MLGDIIKFLRANVWYLNVAFVAFIIYSYAWPKKATKHECKKDCKHEPGEKKHKVDTFSKILFFIENNIPGGATFTSLLKSLFVYVFYRPNPIIQCLYLLVAGGGFIVYVRVGFVEYCPGPYLAEWHKVSGSIVMFICYYSFYKACVTDPGFLSEEK